jgi:hypothetical protein
MFSLSKRPTIILANLLVTLFLASCTKDEVAPQTGDLAITFPYTSQLAGARYLLFTEGTWTNFSRSVDALREGTITNTAGTRTTIQIKNLNAGNYVFVVGSNNWSVQVTAGQNTEVFK